MPEDTAPKHIGIAIEMGRPFGHHHGCYKGIVDYVREHHPDWRTSVDPYLTGLKDDAGQVQYDGIVGRVTRRVADEAQAHGVPVVNHWLNSPVNDTVPSVLTDYHASGEIVGDHFLNHGYRKLGLVSWASDKARPLYLGGLQRAAEKRGAEVFSLDVPYEFEDEPEAFVQFKDLLLDLFKRVTPPLGLFIPMDSMALYAMQLSQQMGLRIPHDVGIAVFYNALDLCLNTHPSMTSIESSNVQIGYEAMRKLDQVMHGEEVVVGEPMLIPPMTLRVRGSSEVFVSEDPVVSSAMRYIAENARDAVTVEEVAEAADVSVRTLSRRFNRYVGRSVLSEINRVRVQAIKQVLVDTEMPMQDVAAACGFTSTSHFSVFFRKAANQTPGSYRKQHRQQA